MISSHTFYDIEGNAHHLGSISRKTGPQIGGQVFSLPLDQIQDGGIEAGLLLLSHWCSEHPGITLTRREIAFACGCSDSLIYDIEQRALERLRKFRARILREHAEGRV